MATVAVLGSGPIASELACSLARTGVASVLLLDEETTAIASGKALDVRQACPIMGSDTRIDAIDRASGHAAFDMLVVADRAQGGQEWTGEIGLAEVARWLPRNVGPVVFAGCTQAWLVERTALELGRPRTTVIGSAPLALEAAVRALTALEADCSPSEVRLTIAGTPPLGIAILWESATISGEAATTRLEMGAIRRLEARVPALWPLGPFALATAARAVIRPLLQRTAATLTCYSMLADRARAIALPVRLRNGEAHSVAKPSSSRLLISLGSDLM